MVEGFGSGTAREGNVEGATGLEGRTAQGFPASNHGIKPGSRFCEFVQKHNKTVPKFYSKAMSNSSVEAGSFHRIG